MQNRDRIPDPLPHPLARSRTDLPESVRTEAPWSEQGASVFELVQHWISGKGLSSNSLWRPLRARRARSPGRAQWGLRPPRAISGWTLARFLTRRHPLPGLFWLTVLALSPFLGVIDAVAQDPAAERLYREASRMEDAGDQEGALEELLLLVQQFPGDQLAPRALLQAVELRSARGDLAGAEAVLRNLLDTYPRTPEAAAGFVQQGQLRRAQANSTAELEEARASWRRVPLLYGSEAFPLLDSRVEARVRSGEMSLLLGDAETAAAELLAAVEDEPPNKWTPRARVSLARAWVELGHWQAAAEVLASVHQPEAVEPGQETLAGIMARTAFQQGQTLIALMHRLHLRPSLGTASWATVQRFPQGGSPLRQPDGVAAAADGRVLVVDGKSKSVLLLDASGRLVEAATLDDPQRPSWNDGRWPYVVTDEEIRLPFSGERNRFLEPRPDREVQLDGMLAAERGVFGEWYVLAKGWKSVLAYTTPRQGREILTKDRPAFVDMARDLQGRIYLLDGKSKQVQRLSRDGSWDGVVLQGSWKRPQALALDPLGRLYVLDRGDNKVHIYSPQGKRLTGLGPTFAGGIELRAPVDVAVDGGGRVFIADNKLPFVVVLE